MKIRRDVEQEKNELNMTSMIDIVFLLLVFFVMTFKIVEMEGDFSINMPLAGSGSSSDDLELPLKLRLRADGEGKLTSISLDSINLGTDYDKLRGQIIEVIRNDGPDSDVSERKIEVDTDYNLRYEYVIRAITAVNGYRDENDQVVPLISNITFAKPRR
ncbi:Biopolymer transport protein ExbD/TolR [Stieleria bergensis]|uniref:Biopolymer transport protein ExbD/TolR n=1 Tax=Stieleria bergensis TaxID=2528025 RepID=A0A517SVW9_9BACT|nr:MAG: biopolymer transporter ExbD [Rhodopirellula sp. TMED11]QDT60282.1 Biopolymer transport protein ExbD/TolR [Planctomycetes bacterium SV_7m_r]